ncbi:MAG: tRNA (N(6)-L-threonylcarbamoyladenosine(37)-C(2))-methylthiotransferase MtaB [Clostridia bacterium]|nr:tRNA (N(6)-L-threonylcarbamoyladenosine(37)-C(2))-methylthiotransferase MtaB [Clostridia bacterium]
MKAAFYTLGCKVNQYESEAMAQRLAAQGVTVVDPAQEADFYVVNSCTVTAESDRKTRQAVRRFKKLHPDSIVVLTGCMPQAFPQASAALEAADIVIGNKSNHLLYDYVLQYLNGGGRIVAIDPHNAQPGEPFTGDTITDFHARTRAAVKIEDGCNRFCSYCIIPYARGRVRSKPLPALREELAALNDAGFCEIVLVGINLSAYGSDLGCSLADAVRLAASFPQIRRVRLGSLEPDHITNDVIAALQAVPEFCPQFHISLQSGCDRTLRRMNRHYDSADYLALCRNLRAAFPDAAITTDIMVGFPGETAEDFETSRAFAETVGFEKIHVFPYSRRAGTPAASMPDQVPQAEKARRAAELSRTAAALRTAAFTRMIGHSVEILPEEWRDGLVQGCTANYTPVQIRSDRPLPPVLTRVTVTGVAQDVCLGELMGGEISDD